MVRGHASRSFADFGRSRCRGKKWSPRDRIRFFAGHGRPTLGLSPRSVDRFVYATAMNWSRANAECSGSRRSYGRQKGGSHGVPSFGTGSRSRLATFGRVVRWRQRPGGVRRSFAEGFVRGLFWRLCHKQSPFRERFGEARGEDIPLRGVVGKRVRAAACRVVHRPGLLVLCDRHDPRAERRSCG